MQRRKSTIRSNWVELIFAVAGLIAIALSTGCASVPEPPWKPDLKVYVSDPSGPIFVGADKVPVMCTDPAMHKFALISYDKLEELKAKHQRCEKWK